MTSKNGALFILKYLAENTDADHHVSSVQLRKLLADNGYPYDPRTVKRQIQSLIDAEYDIFVTEHDGAPTEYHYDQHDWDKTELMILIDAVSSAQFITKQKSDAIIKKLAVLAGRMYKDTLTPKVCVSEHVKAQNNQILYILQDVSTAIERKKKISFRLYNYNTDLKRRFRHNGEVYVLSPYATIWKEDRYYVVGYSEKRQDVVSFRIDRMEKPTILDEDVIPPKADFNIQDYTDVFTKMYGGAKEVVTLLCQSSLIDKVVDKFGTGVQLSNITDDTFEVTAKIAVSGTFLAWVFQYAGQMTILGPENVRDMYQKMLASADGNLAAREVTKLGDGAWKL